MKIIRRTLVGQVLVALLLAVALGATPALADNVVGDGNPAHCTEAAFNTAFAVGGLITFKCGSNPLTIVFSDQKLVLLQNITIDGGGLITLSGGNSNRLFAVASGFTLTLQNLVLEKGNSFGNPGGAVFNNLSTLILDHATIQDSHTSGQPGGAIESNGGAITLINNSLIQNNSGYNYGAINTTGTLALVDSTIRNNTATLGGGGLSLGGSTTINHSQIYSNTASGADGGGGLYLTAPSVVAITATQITSNSAPDSSSHGGGIENYGTLTVDHSSLSGNSSDIGGGLSSESGASATLDQDRLSGNSAIELGGGIYNKGLLTLTNATLSGNSLTGDGGGLTNYGGSATLANSTLTGNSAAAGAGIENAAPLTLINDTLSGNLATGDGGGLANLGGSVMALTNVTFSGNSAPQGSGIAFVAFSAADSLTLKNTIVADSPAGGNCYVFPFSVKGITSAGFNLSSDNSCAAYFTVGSDQNNQPARLWPLANNGGFTLTNLPQHNSPAIDNGTGAGCPATDQRGRPRPQGAACDIGAVEVQPTDLVWPLYLPALRR